MKFKKLEDYYFLPRILISLYTMGAQESFGKYLFERPSLPIGACYLHGYIETKNCTERHWVNTAKTVVFDIVKSSVTGLGTCCGSKFFISVRCLKHWCVPKFTTRARVRTQVCQKINRHQCEFLNNKNTFRNPSTTNLNFIIIFFSFFGYLMQCYCHSIWLIKNNVYITLVWKEEQHWSSRLRLY